MAVAALVADSTVDVGYDMLGDIGKVEDTIAADNVDMASSAPWADSTADSLHVDSYEAARTAYHVCADVDEEVVALALAHRAYSGSCWASVEEDGRQLPT